MYRYGNTLINCCCSVVVGYVEMADTVLAFPLVCYTRHARGALRDDTKNGCVADYLPQATHSRSRATVCRKSEKHQHGFMARATTFSNSNCFVSRLP